MIGRIVIYTGGNKPACIRLIKQSVCVLAVSVMLLMIDLSIDPQGSHWASVLVIFFVGCIFASAAGTLIKNAIRLYDLSKVTK